jgi:hypothetical protein
MNPPINLNTDSAKQIHVITAYLFKVYFNIKIPGKLPQHARQYTLFLFTSTSGT